MNRYTLMKKLGDGTYGSVVKAVNRQTGEEVAVKKMKKMFTRRESEITLFFDIAFCFRNFFPKIKRCSRSVYPIHVMGHDQVLRHDQGTTTAVPHASLYGSFDLRIVPPQL